MRINFNNNFLNFESFSSIKKNMCALKKDGYRKAGKINMLDQDGAIVRGNMYLRDDGRRISVIATDNQAEKIGYVEASPDFDEYKGAYHCSIKNYKNVHPELPPQDGSKVKGYRGVGSRLYQVLEEHLKKHHPEVTRLHAYITNYGSWMFHEKQGFVGHEDGFDIFSIHPIDNLMRKNIKK